MQISKSVAAIALCLILQDVNAGVMDNMVGPDITTTPRPLLFCDYFPALSNKQRQICQENEDFTGQLAIGGKDAWIKCKEIFGNESKVCRFAENNMGYAAFWIPDDSREAAFMYAMRSASYVIKIAEMCEIGKGHICNCPQFTGKKLRERNTGRYNWVYDNCMNSVPFAEKFVKNWTAEDMAPTDPILKLYAEHNLKRGSDLVAAIFFSGFQDDCHCLDGGDLDGCCNAVCNKKIPTLEQVVEILYATYTGIKKIKNL